MHKQEFIDVYRKQNVELLTSKQLEEVIPSLYDKLNSILGKYKSIFKENTLDRFIIFYKILNEDIYVCELTTSTMLYKFIYDVKENILGGNCIHRMANPGQIFHRHVEMTVGQLNDETINTLFNEIISLQILMITPTVFEEIKENTNE